MKCNKPVKWNYYGFGKHKYCNKKMFKNISAGCLCEQHYKEYREKRSKTTREYMQKLKVTNPDKFKAYRKQSCETIKKRYKKDPVFRAKMLSQGKKWNKKNIKRKRQHYKKYFKNQKQQAIANAKAYYNKNKHKVTNPLIDAILKRYYTGTDKNILWEQQFKLCIQQILFLLDKIHFCEYPIDNGTEQVYVDIYVPGAWWIEVKAPYSGTKSQKRKNLQIKELQAINFRQPELEKDLKKLHNIKGKEKVVSITADAYNKDGIYEWLKKMGVK